VVGDGSPAKLQQPLALLPIQSSQSSLIQDGELPAGDILGGANPLVLPLVMLLLLSLKKRRHQNQSLHHSEGDFSVQKNKRNFFVIPNENSFWLRYLPIAA
jgi:hypothetical protein